MKILQILFKKIKQKRFFNLVQYFAFFLRESKVISYPEILSEKDFKDIDNILVLIPHPDDEVFGMGGFSLLLKKWNKKIDLVWFSNADNQARVEESQKVCKYLEIEYSEIDHFPSKGDFVDKALSQKIITQMLEKKKYQLICVPSIFDTHNDHVTLFHALKSVLKGNKTGVNVLQYEVWNSTIPNKILDITEVIEEKKILMSLYPSQLDAKRDYIGRIMGLNKYRGMTYNFDFAEGFILSNVEDFLKF